MGSTHAPRQSQDYAARDQYAGLLQDESDEFAR